MITMLVFLSYKKFELAITLAMSRDRTDQGQGRIQPLERGAQIIGQYKRGFQGAGPLAGVQGAEPPCVGKFWISELNSCDLVHTFCQHHIENLLIYFQ